MKSLNAIRMAYVQIAEVVGASVPQVKTWLHRGRRQLARMLKAYDEGERTGPPARSATSQSGSPHTSDTVQAKDE